MVGRTGTTEIPVVDDWSVVVILVGIVEADHSGIGLCFKLAGLMDVKNPRAGDHMAVDVGSISDNRREIMVELLGTGLRQRHIVVEAIFLLQGHRVAPVV